MWTLFWDMHSGGDTKEAPYEKIYIEAPEEEAKTIFYNKFGHNPERVSCTCCGADYSISSEECLEQLSGFHRNCGYDEKTKKYVEKRCSRYEKYGDDFHPHIPLKDYIKQNAVLVIRAKEINDKERIGDVPEQGYVWKE